MVKEILDSIKFYLTTAIKQYNFELFLNPEKNHLQKRNTPDESSIKTQSQLPSNILQKSLSYNQCDVIGIISLFEV